MSNRDALQLADWSHYLLCAQDRRLVFSTEVSSIREEIWVCPCLVFQAGWQFLVSHGITAISCAKILLVLAERKGVKSRSKPIFGLLYRPLSSKKPSPDRNWRGHGSAGLYYCLEQCWLLMDGMSFLQTLSSLLYAPVPLALPKFPMMRSHPSSS